VDELKIVAAILTLGIKRPETSSVMGKAVMSNEVTPATLVKDFKDIYWVLMRESFQK
jgi:TctA family transporter